MSFRVCGSPPAYSFPRRSPLFGRWHFPLSGGLIREKCGHNSGVRGRFHVGEGEAIFSSFWTANLHLLWPLARGDRKKAVFWGGAIRAGGHTVRHTGFSDGDPCSRDNFAPKGGRNREKGGLIRVPGGIFTPEKKGPK